MGSKIVPSVVAQTTRQNIDTIVGYMGTECILYKVATRTVDKLRDRVTSVSYESGISTHVRIIWSPEIRLLKHLGLYTEGVTPILAFFKFEDDPKKNDYFELEYEYDTGEFKTNVFQVVDRKIKGHGVEQVATWVIAPLRSAP